MNNLVKYQSLVSQHDRQQQAGHQSFVIWFTGLSGAGKSTLAHAVEKALYDNGCRTFVFDGDNVRHGLCADLGFSAEDRQENIRRIGEMSKLFIEAGVIAITAFISPYRAYRARARSLVGDNAFIEIYCNASLDVCEQRDVKGLYKKARAGAIPNFTGISSPYEPPLNPDLEIDTGNASLDACVNKVLAYLSERGLIPTKII
ncbi:MAG TPA: adenylyl-sulfate kinase [Methylophilaceae bacterium]|nr:adenylyl-sulfate kinase [Methylophilaceae bacterium]